MPSGIAKLKELKDIIRALLKEQYADKMETIEPPRPVLESDATLFEALFSVSGRGVIRSKVPMTKAFLSQHPMKLIDTS